MRTKTEIRTDGGRKIKEMNFFFLSFQIPTIERMKCNSVRMNENLDGAQ